jgi:oligoendopeptidase F
MFQENFGGVSIGIFIFMNPDRPEDWLHDTRIHEYGHTIQSLVSARYGRLSSRCRRSSGAVPSG